jgi:hypothetical protein
MDRRLQLGLAEGIAGDRDFLGQAIEQLRQLRP